MSFCRNCHRKFNTEAVIVRHLVSQPRSTCLSWQDNLIHATEVLAEEVGLSSCYPSQEHWDAFAEVISINALHVRAYGELGMSLLSPPLLLSLPLRILACSPQGRYHCRLHHPRHFG